MRHATLLLPVLLLAACGESGGHDLFQTGAVQDTVDGKKITQVPDFMFQERSGKELTRDSLKGKVWIASLIFTRCKTSCIPMCGEMAMLQDELEDEKDFRIVAFTVDPDFDTIETLDKFGKVYDADPERWFFARNTIEATKEFAEKGLKVVAWHPEDRLAHSTYFVLVDRDGWVRGYFNQTHRDRMDALRKTLRRVLAEKSP